MSEQGLLIDLPAEGGARTCWYCGSRSGPWESEHQTPVSRGGGAGGNIVDACARCNHLKGKLTVEEFREALAARLGVSEVVFWGEAAADAPATEIRTVRSLAGDREVTRLDPVVSDRLNRAVRYYRATGLPRMNRKDLASRIIDEGLRDLAVAELGDGEDFPDSMNPMLFDDVERRPIFRPGETSRTPKAPMSREVTKIGGVLLDQLRQAVDILRTEQRHDLTLLELVNEAAARLVHELGEQYPQLGPPAVQPGASGVRLGTNGDLAPHMD